MTPTSTPSNGSDAIQGGSVAGSASPAGAAGSPLKNSLGEAGGHLKQAARDAGDAIKGASGAAGDQLRVGKAHVKSDLADSALAGITAAEYASAAARERADEWMDKGRDLVDSAAELVRERPIASFGAAFAAGWIIAKLGRGSRR